MIFDVCVCVRSPAGQLLAIVGFFEGPGQWLPSGRVPVLPALWSLGVPFFPPNLFFSGCPREFSPVCRPVPFRGAPPLRGFLPTSRYFTRAARHIPGRGLNWGGLLPAPNPNHDNLDHLPFVLRPAQTCEPALPLQGQPTRFPPRTPFPLPIQYPPWGGYQADHRGRPGETNIQRRW